MVVVVSGNLWSGLAWEWVPRSVRVAGPGVGPVTR